MCLCLLSLVPESTEAPLGQQSAEGLASARRRRMSGDGLVDALDRLAQILDPLLSEAATERRTGAEEKAMGRTRSADVYMYHQPLAGGAGGPLVLL